ncbi:MAG: hypothetical protein K2J48_01675 [Muribaculaceae bacterium]|nr:hypothetical protein [Muribaculaceae bacterium]
MPGILSYTLEDYQQSARTYRSDLLRLPILALSRILAHMTLRPGVRYEEVVGQTDLDIELQPYVRDARQNKNLELGLRILKTYFGTVNNDFDPNANISTLLGHRASLASGSDLASTPQAHEILAMTPKAIGKKLLLALFKAKRNPAGTRTLDLFDGFDTIIDQEKADGNISAEKGNYLKLSVKPDKLNSVEIWSEILDHISPELREEETEVFCAQSIVDNYNRAYKLETGNTAYNKEYNQTCVEGTNDMMRFCPTAAKIGSKYITISVKENMLVGVDQLSDQESVKIGNYSPDTLTVMMRMFFGCQYESIDNRRLFIVELPSDDDIKQPAQNPESDPNA